jgi:tetratricopeptide (TPR) repeat protein
MLDSINNCLISDNFKEALNLLNQVIQFDSLNVDLIFSRGTVYDKLGYKAQAEKDYLKCLAKDPGYFSAAYNLGVLYFNSAAELNNGEAAKDTATYRKRTVLFEDYLSDALSYFKIAYKSSPVEEEESIKQIIKAICNGLHLDYEREISTIDLGSLPKSNYSNIQMATAANSISAGQETQPVTGSIEQTFEGTVKEVVWYMNSSSWGSGLLFYLTIEERPNNLYYFRIKDYDKYGLIEFTGPKELGLCSPSSKLDEWKGVRVRFTFTKVTDKSRYPEKVLTEPAFYIENLEKQ